MKRHPELLDDDASAAKAILGDLVRDSLRQTFGPGLENSFDEALECLKLELKPCEGLFSETELRRIIGTEIAWYRLSANATGTQDELAHIREQFMSEVRYGVEPLLDADSPTRRIVELAAYRRSWANFPAFGFGIWEFDSATGGILPGEICAMTGAPGTMKTSLALSAVDDFVTRAEGLVYYCSVDMAPREITHRLMEREGRVSSAELSRMFDTDDPELKQLTSAVIDKYDGRLVIRCHKDSRHMTVDDLLTNCLKRQPQLIIVDYLTRLKLPGQGDLEFVELAMPKILDYAHQYQASFLLLSQMSRVSRAEQTSGRSGGHSKGGGIVEELSHMEIELSH
jgi:replicative DNA helicase